MTTAKIKRRPKTETMGERITRLRKQQGLTQMEVAAYLNVDQPRVSQYERGELRLHGEVIIAMAKLYKVSADELLGIEKPKNPDHPTEKKFARRLKQIGTLSRRDQQSLLRTIDAFLKKAS